MKKRFPKPEEPAPDARRAAWVCYLMDLKAWKRGYERLTTPELRQRFSFSGIRQRSALEEVPRYQDIPEAVKDAQRARDFFTSEWYMRQWSRADFQGAPMPLRLFVWRFSRALRKRGIPMYVHTCYRSPQLQASLFKEGHTKVKSGAHQRSAAVDIVCSVEHWQRPEPYWTFIGTLGEAVARDTDFGYTVDSYRPDGSLVDKPTPLKIEWGGRWSFYDPAHWQLSDWKKRPIVNPGPRLELPPYSDKMRFG